MGAEFFYCNAINYSDPTFAVRSQDQWRAQALLRAAPALPRGAGAPSLMYRFAIKNLCPRLGSYNRNKIPRQLQQVGQPGGRNGEANNKPQFVRSIQGDYDA